MKKLLLLLMGIGIVSAHGGGASVQFTPLAIPMATEPFISSIQLEGTNVVVSASVPPGFASVTLESNKRLNGQAWTPLGVGRLNRSAGRLVFRLPRSSEFGLLRLRVDSENPLPDFFFNGQTSFDGQSVSTLGGSLNGSTDGSVVFDSAPGANDSGLTARTVAESDIWKLNGDTLFFYNQYRGLQVIDVSHPDVPVIRGSLALSAAGEQMYLLDDNHVILLARTSCGWSSPSESQVIVVEIAGGQPEKLATLQISGSILESRMVGTALYVASGSYRQVQSTNSPNSYVWEWINEVASFDLSQPDHPVARSTSVVPGSYGAVVTATDHYFFLAGEKFQDRSATWIPTVYVFDISATDGTLAQVSEIKPFGRVQDKFGMNFINDTFTIVSGSWNGTTMVETFSLADVARPAKLGSLVLTRNESLYATQFSSNQLYVVTYHQVDPLWVIDLSNPSQPRISGQLQVPGFSTYLYPWGDRLVAVGRDSGAGSQTTVSLFDVHDPVHPALLGRVAPGKLYSYSEANYDEKAFGVLPELGLILLPFTSYTGSNTIQGVQLIDLNHDSLTLRGLVSQDVVARRCTVHRDRVLSLSGRELLSIDATDRDHPVLKSSTPLSWPVDQVFLSGDFLMELEFGWGNGGIPRIRITPSGDPNQVLDQASLTNLPVLGATLQDQLLYIAQGQSASILSEWDAQHQTNIVVTNLGVISLSVWDTSHLPDLTLRGTTSSITLDSFANTWKPLWPDPGLLIWQAAPGYFMGWPWNISPVDALGPVSGGTVVRGGFASGPFDVFWPWWWGWGYSRFIAFEVREPSAPRLVSVLDLYQTNTWGGSVQDAFAGDASVYTSHREYETVVAGTNYYVYTNTYVEYVATIVRTTNVTSVPKYVRETTVIMVTNSSSLVINRSPGSANSWQWPKPEPLSGVLASSGAHSVLLDSLSSAWAWGANEFGQQGDGSRTGEHPSIALVPNLDGIRAVAAGSFHNLVATSSGKVWAWGGGFLGQLGHGAPTSVPGQPPVPYDGSPVPVDALGLTNIISVAAGAYHSLALSAEGEVWAWGANDSGQVGVPISGGEFVPKVVATLSGVKAIAGGGSYSLALLHDGTAWAWGANDFGQLGTSWPNPTSDPALVSGVSNIVAIASGRWHSLAASADGTVWGWGRSDSGQLGQHTARTTANPVQVSGISGAQSIAAGPYHSVALKTDGTVWTWGNNDYGQLGRDPQLTAGAPGPVVGLTNAIAIAAGDRFSVALAGDGALWAWGDQAKGQLGEGDSTTISWRELRTNVTDILVYISVTNVIAATNYQAVTRTEIVTNAYPNTIWVAHDYLDVIDYTVPTNPVVRLPANLPGALQGISHHGALLYTISERSEKEGGKFARSVEASAYDGVNAHLVDSLVFSDLWPQPVLVRDAVIYLGLSPADANSTAKVETWQLSTSGKFTRLTSVDLATPAQELKAFGNLLVVRATDSIALLDAHTPADLNLVGRGGPDGCVYFDLSRADGSLQGGVWLALSDYGVSHIKAGPTGQP